MANQNSSRRDVQFLRAFAVLAVIAYHFGFGGFGGGFVGVDIFFVISGYLIFGKVYLQLVRGDFSLKRFFEARIRRIFPALAVMVVATALWGWYFVLPRDYLYYSRTALAALSFVSNHAFMGPQGYFDAASHTKPMLHTWSLSIEGQFYFWLPLVLIAIFKVRQGMRVPILLALAASASLAWTLWLAYRAPESGFYVVAARAWEFLAGAIVATLVPAKFRRIEMLLLVCVIALMASVSLLGETGPWPNVWTLIPVCFAAVFIYAGVNAQNNPVIANRGVQLIGDMSYSLYLWHWPVWVFATQQYDNHIPAANKIALLFLTFIIAYLSWRWVEQPFRDRNRVTTGLLKTATIGMLLCALAFTAFVVVTKGYPGRFPDYVARVSIQSAQNTPRNECFRSGFNTKEKEDQFCVFGTPRQAKDATAMLWGDSFANQYLTGLSNASSAHGVTGLIATMSGCRAFIENDSTPASPYCKDFNREVYGFLLSHPEIKTVILGRAVWDIDETVSLVRNLITEDRKVILVAPSPNPGVHVENTWATKQIRAGHPIEEIKLDRSPLVTQAAILEKLKEQLGADMAQGKVFLIDPTRRFCDAQFCYLVRDGVATFRDQGHFTEIAEQEMEPDFREALVWANNANSKRTHRFLSSNSNRAGLVVLGQLVKEN